MFPEHDAATGMGPNAAVGAKMEVQRKSDRTPMVPTTDAEGKVPLGTALTMRTFKKPLFQEWMLAADPNAHALFAQCNWQITSYSGTHVKNFAAWESNYDAIVAAAEAVQIPE